MPYKGEYERKREPQQTKKKTPERFWKWGNVFANADRYYYFLLLLLLLLLLV